MTTRLPDDLLLQVGQIVRERLGLHFPIERARDLEAALGVVAPSLGCVDAESCAHQIVGQPLEEEDLKVLAQALTVGETSFCRDGDVFQSLEHDILPTIVEERRATDRRIRIWSAGCCTGEEPYTIAMILRRLLPDIESWNVTLLATDVNADFLARAERGVYGRWSFRRTPQWMSHRYFSARSDGKYSIDPVIREMVRFEYLNLAEGTYPSVFNNTNAMDVVLCRNVLIYFDQPTVQRVVEQLGASLLPGGWLALGRSERVPEEVVRFDPVTLRGEFWYRRTPAALADEPIQPAALEALNGAAEADARQPTPFPVNLEQRFEVGDYARVARDLTAYLKDANPSRADRRRAMRILAQACANLGRLAEAQSWCEEALSEDNLDPRLHYLMASVLLERDCAGEAEVSLQRALFADDRFVLAHFALGNLTRRAHDPGRAREHYQRTVSLLRHYRPEEILPDSEGLTAGRLSEIAEQALSQC